MAAIIIGALSFAVSTQAAEPPRGPYTGPCFGDWDRTDSLLLTTALSAIAIDWARRGTSLAIRPGLTPTPRKWFLRGVTAVEVVVIISNHGAGIRADF